jgi:hypothetical protein
MKQKNCQSTTQNSGPNHNLVPAKSQLVTRESRASLSTTLARPRCQLTLLNPQSPRCLDCLNPPVDLTRLDARVQPSPMLAPRPQPPRCLKRVFNFCIALAAALAQPRCPNRLDHRVASIAWSYPRRLICLDLCIAWTTFPQLRWLNHVVNHVLSLRFLSATLAPPR